MRNLRCTEPAIAGVDEVGRGPLAGPVICAAVILDPRFPICGLADSKTLSPRKRLGLSHEIKQRALDWAVGRADAAEIDHFNILSATFLAMQRAVKNLSIKPSQILVDGRQCPKFSVGCKAIVKGDKYIACISAASIIAKVTRDQEMIELHEIYPCYGFEKHKGYPTKEHKRALREFGPCPDHRKTFKPVHDVMSLKARQ